MKKIMIIMAVIMTIIVLGLWLILYVRTEKSPETVKINSFKDCAEAGNPVMESYPRQCRAGGQTFTEYIGNELEKTDLIVLDSPRPNQMVKSPLLIKGKARGFWFFEADFPVLLKDQNGSVIGRGIAIAGDEWMTEEFVPFTAEIEFRVSKKTDHGTLILQKDNPSDLPKNDDMLVVPVFFEQGDEAPSSFGRESAFLIARESKECSNAGILTDKIVYNENSKTWWIDLERMPELEKDGCNPACVVSEETRTAEVNWRCTGLREPAETVKCVPEQRNADLCTTDYDPVCAKVNVQCITTPCDPVNETFSNACKACKNPLTESYIAGECS